MNIYLVLILGIIILQYTLNTVVELLNLKSMSASVPKEFIGLYDEIKYKKSQEYLKDTTVFKVIEDLFFVVAVISFILFGGFNYVDIFARSFGKNYVITGLIFSGVIVSFFYFFNVVFSAYRTFVIESKYGFNRTSVRTFLMDVVKSAVLGVVIGGVFFGAVIWFFEKFKIWGWLYCWVAVSIFQVFLTFIAPVVIMPIFNKFMPLNDGELKEKIEDYAKSQNFMLNGIFTVDGSRRSTKSNAFFAGFGRFRRVALFDTLISRHTPDEIVSVLAHEIGHYKKKHAIKNMLFSIFSTGLMLFLLSFFINNEMLFSAFRMEKVSVYASLLFFGFLYTPISFIFSVLFNALSRKYEYEADRFSVATYNKPDEMVSALKKLSVDNFSNLTPHPAKVYLHYSHPPVIKRIEAIRDMAEK